MEFNQTLTLIMDNGQTQRFEDCCMIKEGLYAQLMNRSDTLLGWEPQIQTIAVTDNKHILCITFGPVNGDVAKSLEIIHDNTNNELKQILEEME